MFGIIQTWIWLFDDGKGHSSELLGVTPKLHTPDRTTFALGAEPAALSVVAAIVYVLLY